MANVKKNLATTAVVALTIGALLAGGLLREQVDAGPNILQRPDRSSFFASLEDPKVPESDFFFQLTQLVKREYVDPVQDEATLAEGAVRGMIAGLSDPRAEFMKKESFAAFRRMQQGIFDGIGVELTLHYDDEQKKWLNQLEKLRTNPEDESPITTPGVLIPSLRVTAVAPNGPAARAGMKVGDVVTEVDGKRVLDSSVFREFQDLQAKVRKGEAMTNELTDLRKRLADDAKHAMTPGRAREKLVTGTTGAIEVKWRGIDGAQGARLTKRPTQVQPVAVASDGSIKLSLFEGAEKSLPAAIANKTSLTLDLRNSTIGDFRVMREVLNVLAAPGELGAIAPARQKDPTPLAVSPGNSNPPNITLLVDSSTRGAAQILARALVTRGAKVEGKLGSDAADMQVVQLPQGSGYILPVGEFKPLAKKEAGS